jgi:hypothetical protein
MRMRVRARCHRRVVSGRIRPGAVCAFLLLIAVAGCSSEAEGPTDEEIRAEMQGLLDAFQRKMKAEPDEGPAFFPADRLREFMGLQSYRYRELGARMLADATWKTIRDGRTGYVGLTLVRMDSAEGARKALAADTEGFTDAAPLAGSVVPRGADRILAFADGHYYVTLSDMGETAAAPAFLRRAAGAMAAALKDARAPQTEP